jgi:acetyl esterase/lipase
VRRSLRRAGVATSAVMVALLGISVGAGATPWHGSVGHVHNDRLAAPHPVWIGPVSSIPSFQSSRKGGPSSLFAPPIPLSKGAKRVIANSSTTVSYGSSLYQTVTVYPAPTTGAPLVILVHGGGWDSKVGSDQLPTEAKDLQDAGFAVFDVNYDTMPRSHGAFPLEIDDVVNATAWAIAHADLYGADPTNVEMIGGSAGGQLVAMAAEELNAAAPGTVRSIVTLSGALDFVLKMEDIQDGLVRGYDAIHSQEALGCRLKDGTCTVALETRWSPAEQVNSGDCPAKALIINSSHEAEPVDQANSMTSALDAGGCMATELIRDGHGHSFAYWNSVKAEVAMFVSAN